MMGTGDRYHLPHDRSERRSQHEACQGHSLNFRTAMSCLSKPSGFRLTAARKDILNQIRSRKLYPLIGETLIRPPEKPEVQSNIPNENEVKEEVLKLVEDPELPTVSTPHYELHRDTNPIGILQSRCIYEGGGHYCGCGKDQPRFVKSKCFHIS